MLEGIVFRYRMGCPWRDVPDQFGPWKTLWKRHARFSKDGTWDRLLEPLLAVAEAAGQIDWQLSMDSTVSRVHQHAATFRGRSPRGCRATQGDAGGTPGTTRDSR